MSILSGVDALDPSKASALEGHLAKQLAGSAPYDPASNLALLRLYALAPARPAGAAAGTAGAFAAAIRDGTPADAALLLHLTPERVQDDPAVAPLIALAHALDAARYADFWTAAAQPATAAALGVAKGWEAAVRARILGAVGDAYARGAPTAVLGEALALPAGEAGKAAVAAGWSLEGGGAVVVPPAALAAGGAGAEDATAAAAAATGPPTGCPPLADIAPIVALAREL